MREAMEKKGTLKIAEKDVEGGAKAEKAGL